MVELTPKARALLKTAQTALRATDADRARIDAALRARLGPDALPAKRTLTRVPSAARWQLAAAGALGIGLVGALVVWGSRRDLSPHAQEAHLAPQLDETRDAPAPLDTALPEVPEQPAVRATDGLTREVALLSRATSELRAGRAERALRALAEHERQFPNGVLNEERRAAKAQALCSLGRVSEGRAELTRLAPHSPAAARARQACHGGQEP